MNEAIVDAKHLARPFLRKNTTSPEVLVMIGNERSCFGWVVRKGVDDRRGFVDLTRATREEVSAIDQQFFF